MTDKISGFSPAEPVKPVKGSNGKNAVIDRQQRDLSQDVGSASQTGDHVTLTNSARSLQKVEEAISKAPVVNTDRVAAVKQSIGNGSYQVNAQSTADKLLSFERGLK